MITTQYTYLAGHYWNSERDPRGGVSTTSYYADGRISSLTSSVGDVTGFAYDQALRRTTVTNPDGGTEVTDLDANGDVVRRVDGLGRVMTMAYDANRNLVSETNGLGLTKQYTYDANGFRTSVRDPLGNTSTAVFNAYGGPTSLANALGQPQTEIGRAHV